MSIGKNMDVFMCYSCGILQPCDCERSWLGEDEEEPHFIMILEDGMRYDITAEREASQVRQAERDTQRAESMSPWMQYILYLYGLYPNNPISLLWMDETSAPRVRPIERKVPVRGSDGTGPIVWNSVRDVLVEADHEYEARINRLAAPDEIERFTTRLPEEHTFTSWLATQED